MSADNFLLFFQALCIDFRKEGKEAREAAGSKTHAKGDRDGLADRDIEYGV